MEKYFTVIGKKRDHKKHGSDKVNGWITVPCTCVSAIPRGVISAGGNLVGLKS